MTVDAFDLDQWGAEMDRLAQIFQNGFAAVHGFEPGEHVVRSATETAALPDGTHDTLVAYYSRMGAVELPDLGNGLWIEDVPTLLSTDHPVRLIGAVDDTVTGFATDGGGGHYAVSDTTGCVYHLFAGALHEDGLYDVSEAGHSVVAPDLWTFLDGLRTNLAEAVTAKR